MFGIYFLLFQGLLFHIQFCHFHIIGPQKIAQFFCLLLPIAGGILWWIQKDKPPARVAVATGPVAPEPENTAS